MNILVNAGRWVRNEARDLHALLIFLLVFGAVIITEMWVVNVWLWPAINIPQTLAGALLLVITATKPKVIFTVTLLGGLVQGLRDEDITQGTIKGIGVLFKVLWGALFYFTAIGTVLSLISFAWSPITFWAVALVILTVQAMFAYYEVKTEKLTRRMVITAGILLVIYFFLHLFAPGLVRWLGNNYKAWDLGFDRRAEIVELCSKEPNHERCRPASLRPAAPSEPIRYTHGKTLNLRPGGSLLILLAGEIRVLNYEKGHCMNFAPEGQVTSVWNDIFSVALVSPKGAPEKEVLITKLRPGEGGCPA